MDVTDAVDESKFSERVILNHPLTHISVKPLRFKKNNGKIE
jgi:hypothetical protein